MYNIFRVTPAVTRPVQEEVWNAEAKDGNEEIENSSTEGNAPLDVTSGNHCGHRGSLIVTKTPCSYSNEINTKVQVKYD